MSGFYGSVSKRSCIDDVFYGTDYHSHLGTKRAGLVFYDREIGFRRRIHNLENEYFRSKFEAELKEFKGNSGMGIISDTDPQPILFDSHLGRFALVTVSKIVNINELADYFLARKKHFTENFMGNINPTEMVANLICEGDSYVEGIENVFDKIQGSCSLLLLTTDGIIAARDKLGRTPVVIGMKEGARAVVSETCSLPNTGFETEYYLGPGEIVHIRASGFTRLKAPGRRMQICSFLWVYYGFPTSEYEGRNVEEVRYGCGAALARRDPVKADLVCGVPDSGVGHAIGYSNEKQLPYMSVFSKYTPTWPRSFTPQRQVQRELVAKMKLIPNKKLIKGRKIIFLDDSIVRGTQMRNNTRDLRDAGAAELHMRIACPPLLYPCQFLNFSQSRSTLELAARKAIIRLEGDEKKVEEYLDPDSEKYGKMVKEIARDLGMDSLMFQRLDDLVKAIGLPREKLCTHCWDGSSSF
ncbi:MAG: amidophosphoribosyltransferase [Bacteroidales bacterium]|nr:amidophosphoribosyltransferase [Bacteroidales bacterium]